MQVPFRMRRAHHTCLTAAQTRETRIGEGMCIPRVSVLTQL